jgi:putative phosphoribosyl transferase
VTAADEAREVVIPIGTVTLRGVLRTPRPAHGLVLFAHGSGSSRLSPRNSAVACYLHDRGLATLLFDLLTPDEEAVDLQTAELRFNISLLAERLEAATGWVLGQRPLKPLPIGYFGASTGAAAALVAAARIPAVSALVSRGGRPDLAGAALPQVRAPTLLIVGSHDAEVLELNRSALSQLICEATLEVVPGATHLFEEPGALEQVEALALAWFERHLLPGDRLRPRAMRRRNSSSH